MKREEIKLAKTILKSKIFIYLVENYQNINRTNCFLFISSLYVYIISFISYFRFELKDYRLFSKLNQTTLNNLIHNKEIEIYRIEDIAGIGPYHSLLYNASFLKINENDDEKNPTPYIDMFDIWNELTWKNLTHEFNFGFVNMKQLNNWFTKEELDKLYKNGFSIKKYKTNIYYQTKKQVLFKKIENIS
jgi:hypothetical protein